MLATGVRSSLQVRDQQGAPHMDEWIGVKDAAEVLDVSVSTVLRSFKDQETADRQWGPGNWRRKPLTPRREMQVRRSRAEELAAQAIGYLGEDDANEAL
jgi:AraC-like DNA-binding protein